MRPAPRPTPSPSDTQPPQAPSVRGRLLVLSGPSGAGKTSLAERLLKDPRFGRAITATTRAPRAGEVPGVHYHFLSEAAFREGLAQGAFLEHAEVYGRLYGTPRTSPEAVLASGRHCVLVLDVQGAASLRALATEACFVFVAAPSVEELRKRLSTRGLDGPEAIERRLERVGGEMAEAPSFHLVVVNDDLERTARRIASALGVHDLRDDPGNDLRPTTNP